MKPVTTGFALAVLSAMLFVAPTCFADDAAFGKDLMATIALQGLPCDKVVASRRNADSDYVATCKDGHRYHIYVNTAGRVVVEKA